MSNMRRTMVAGNWKENGSLALIEAFNAGLTKPAESSADIVICPPYPFLSACKPSEHFSLGAQDLSQFESGAHTGQVSGEMLKEVGCDYVIVGHSERRTEFGESNELVAEKALIAIKAGLTPIVCFGEPEAVRKSGELFEYIDAQVNPVIRHIGVENIGNIVFAYEPIWAIGTGLTASPEQAQEVHQHVRNVVDGYSEKAAENITILYGGSVKAENAETLFSQPDIDGGLIGGASLKLGEFLEICRSI